MVGGGERERVGGEGGGLRERRREGVIKLSPGTPLRD